MALIGCGGMGRGDAKSASRFGNIVAVCDVDKSHAEQARTEKARALFGYWQRLQAAGKATRGSLVKAYVVLAPGFEGTAQLVDELQQHVRGKLAPYEYPKEIAFIDALPMTTTGKVQRRHVAASLSLFASVALMFWYLLSIFSRR